MNDIEQRVCVLDRSVRYKVDYYNMYLITSFTTDATKAIAIATQKQKRTNETRTNTARAY